VINRQERLYVLRHCRRVVNCEAYWVSTNTQVWSGSRFDQWRYAMSGGLGLTMVNVQPHRSFEFIFCLQW